MTFFVMFLLAGDILANAGAHILIKEGMSRHGEGISRNMKDALLRILLNPFAMGGILAYGLSFLFYAALLSKVDLSFAYPFCVGAAFLLVLWGSILFFKERLNPWRCGGTLAIFLGIIVMTLDV
ncbi:MAG TPA: hypothetical protein PK364_01120 [Synergistaceae bacterium]|nr:hypothetical protein [Synergistaceae bacterium]HPJ25655.1 hypothetical protein [Synergistaceae bacterium]HPQ37967.1 hypothetical protein [Synergistaceae bacterium]